MPRSSRSTKKNNIDELLARNEEFSGAVRDLESCNRQLRELTVELNGLLNSTIIAMVVLDENLHLRRFNGRAQSLLGLSPDDAGRPLTDIAIPFQIPGLPELVRTAYQDLATHELEIQDAEGRWYELWVQPYKEAENRLGGAVLTLVDIHERKKASDTLEIRVRERMAELESAGEALKTETNERKRAEERLHQSQKMEAIGRLAGGVAHDFNNLLTIISGYTELALGRLPADSSVRTDLQQVMSATERATTLTNHLLAFSRRQPAQPKVLDLNQFIPETEKILRRVIPEQIEMRSVFHPAPLFVRFDQGQLEQVLMNLVLNARDAMPGGGRITIETSAATPEDEQIVPGSRASEHVVFSVSDTGNGMSKEIQTHLFEPFFTTKARGKGTGLGLSTVYGIVKQHGGEISVRSAPNQGTTVRIYLKRAAGEPAQRLDEGAAASERGGETVLLVEDEASLRQMARHILEQQGYRVLDAGDGEEALRIFEDNRNSVDVLLTDVVMPQMNGKQLADRLKKQKPELKIVFMSGYTNEVLEQHGIRAGDDNLIRKPFTSQTLGTMLRKKLETHSKA